MAPDYDPLPSDKPAADKGLINNVVSLGGIALALICAINILFLVVLDYFQPSPYIGIFAFMVIPAILVFGLLLIPIGMLLERHRRRKLAPGEIPRMPVLDLNSQHQRRVLAIVLALTTVFVGLSAAGSYRAYQFTDSVQFCGRVCHTVMNPEYTTYLESPHARVACVECHVGSGASWYVRSKLSGSYQVYSATFHKYPRPIPTPVANLRPAQQTCEQCHWPSRFYGAQLKVFTHFAYDEKNTPHQIRMLINIGGAEPMAGQPSGIHWHMNIANRVTFVSSDAQNQEVPWVQIQDRQGHITTYLAKDSKLTPQQIQQSPKHLMDCINCHDRPSHIFRPPDESVDQALVAGRLDPSMPFIKQQAVAALTTSYSDEESAMNGIEKSLSQYYSSKNVPATRVKNAVAEVQRIYRGSIFPYMKVDWRTHPNNVGHYYFPGCFRCHDGQHVSPEGKVIPNGCNTCHEMLSQEETKLPVTANPPNVEFKHPVDIGDLTAVKCSDCHTGSGM
ncbi:MAG TPA: NapC/NirT family cytochrome c [Terriglobales bacterium]|nr:NapC/NirT family cytochrome c [Terriglobales bacterium]